jgi:DNA gyrase/topoisomerase IV subunit A
MMAEFDLNDRQAEAILNMRLRSCAGSKNSRSPAKTRR